MIAAIRKRQPTGKLLVLVGLASLASATAEANPYTRLIGRWQQHRASSAARKLSQVEAPRAALLTSAPHERTLDEGLLSAYAGAVMNAARYSSTPSESLRVPSIERLQQIEQLVDQKLTRATVLRLDQQAARQRLAAADPEGASAMEAVEGLSKARSHLVGRLADLDWDKNDSRSMTHAAPSSDSIRRLVDDDVKDVERHERTTRAELAAIDVKLSGARSKPDHLRFTAALEAATQASRHELETLRQPEADEPGLSVRSIARVQRGLAHLESRIGDGRALFTKPLSPLALVKVKQRDSMLAAVAQEFHHLDLGIEEARAWLLDPAAYNQRLSALEKVQSQREQLLAQPPRN